MDLINKPGALSFYGLKTKWISAGLGIGRRLPRQQCERAQERVAFRPHARTALHRSRCRLLGRSRRQRCPRRRAPVRKLRTVRRRPDRPGRRLAARYAMRLGIDALAALLRRELAKRPGVSVTISAWSSAGSSPFSRTANLKDGETPSKTRDRLSNININVHVSRSPRAPPLADWTRSSAPARITRTTKPRRSAAFARWRARPSRDDPGR
jgi:hypothetical protein